MSVRSLYTQPSVQQPLLWGQAGGRIKKGIEYVRHYMPEFRSPLEAADLIMVTDVAGMTEFYMIDPRTKPMYTGKFRKSLATKWSLGIGPLAGNVNPGRNPIDWPEINVALGEIALWKVYADTGGFMFDIEQPSNTPVFSNGINPTRLHFGNTGYNAQRGIWAAVPEIATFEDKTLVTLNALPTNMNEAIYNAYVAAEGFRYRLIKVQVPNPADEPRVVMTIQLSAMV